MAAIYGRYIYICIYIYTFIYICLVDISSTDATSLPSSTLKYSQDHATASAAGTCPPVDRWGNLQTGIPLRRCTPGTHSSLGGPMLRRPTMGSGRWRPWDGPFFCIEKQQFTEAPVVPLDSNKISLMLRAAQDHVSKAPMLFHTKLLKLGASLKILGKYCKIHE